MASAGVNQNVSFLYPPTNVGGAGGGGKARTQDGDYLTDNETDMSKAAPGGSPGGGAGSCIAGMGDDSYYGQPATKYGAGGGGGFSWIYKSGLRTDIPNAGGAGKQGVVGFMWRFKS